MSNTGNRRRTSYSYGNSGNVQRSGQGSSSASRRRMSRKRRQQIMRRRRMVFAGIMLALLVLGLAGTVFVIKAVTSGKDNAAGKGPGSQNQNNIQNNTGNVAAGDSTRSGAANNWQTEADTPPQTRTDTTQPPKGQDESRDASALANADSTFTTSKGFKGYVKDGVTYIDGYIIVNKTYALPAGYIPQDTEVPVTSEWSTTSLNKELMQAYRQLKQAAAAQNLNIYISSGYRSYNTQKNLYNNYVSRDGKAKADTYSARAGHSEHQTGICFDLNTIDDSFQYTDEGIWVNDNAYKYGFIIRYPKGKEHLTGYQYESWHLRYVGMEMAEKLYNNGDWITMEEYFGISSRYED